MTPPRCSMKWPYNSGEMAPIGSPGTMSICASTLAEACENMRGPRRASAGAARAEDLSAVRRVIFMARPRYQMGRQDFALLRHPPRRAAYRATASGEGLSVLLKGTASAESL